MNCPYCEKTVFGMTGLQEVRNFEKHLRTCRKNPANIVLPDAGGKSVLMPLWRQNLMEALEIRADSGQ
jgi:hypothetical protein